MKPLCIDLFCGLFGWGVGFASEGYRVLGFDLEQHGPVPDGCQLVLQDVLTLHGSQFKDAAVIVASPPCQAYSYRAMPWKRAKALPPPSNELFDACFRIQREASEAAGRKIPMVVENVKGAQPWVGRARWHYGSYYLWGDVPALMPFSGCIAKVPGLAPGTFPGGGLAQGAIDNARKVPGFNFHEYEKTGKPGRSFQSAAVDGMKVPGIKLSEVGFNVAAARSIDPASKPTNYVRTAEECRQHISYTRKQASAQIAKIPFSLSQHIARVYAAQEPA